MLGRIGIRVVFVLALALLTAAGYVGQESAMLSELPEGDGIAAKYPGDQGIEQDPAVVFADGFEDCSEDADLRRKWNYSVWHEGADLIETIRANIDYMGHFHTAGNPGRGQLDENQEIYYPAVCRSIVDAGYDLYLGHEFESKGDPIAALEAAYKTCDV